MWSWHHGLQARVDDCSLSCNESCPGGVDSCSECGPKLTLIAGPARLDCRPLHLGAAARGVLDLPAAERIDHMRRPRWIGYTRAKQLLDKLDDLLTHPKTHRMPNLLIVGDTNAGKTMLANRFLQ